MTPPGVTTVYFDTDKTSLKPQNAALLEAFARQITLWLADHPGAKVIIAGHTDERGTEEYNLTFSRAMAEAVRNRLQKLGVPQERMEIVAHGKSIPADPGHNKKAWSKNRRVEIHLNPKGP